MEAYTEEGDEEDGPTGESTGREVEAEIGRKEETEGKDEIGEISRRVEFERCRACFPAIVRAVGLVVVKASPRHCSGGGGENLCSWIAES